MTTLNRILVIILPLFMLSACESLPSSIYQSPNPDPEQTAPPDENSALDLADQNVLPLAHEDIWERIREGYGLPDIENSLIDTQIHTYLKKQQYINHFTERSAPYIHYIVSELEANDMPLELALLPIIESSYNPFAHSSHNAAGIWQFVPKTGKSFGLEQNGWYDGRRDLIASTDAAIRYLQQLHTMFDEDWLLALAAYNAGQGTLRRAIRKNQAAGKPTDFWSLPLPKQTQAYIPRLLALSRIIAEPADYNLTLQNIPNDPYFTSIDIDAQINLAQIAQLAKIDIKEIQQLNAGYNRWLTDPSQPHQVLVPIADAPNFIEQLAIMPKLPVIKWQEYTVKKGDTLGAIARRFNTNIATLKANNQLKSDFLRINQQLQIASAVIPLTLSNYPNAEELMRNYGKRHHSSNRYHIVKPGDSLWKIARQYKTTITKLLHLNSLSRTSKIKPGQKLFIG